MSLIRITDEIVCPCPSEKALDLLQDLTNIQKYEPKVESAQVYPTDHKSGFYAVSGLFAGLPWKGKFSYEHTEKGFHSEMQEGPLAGKVRGGFVVSRQSDIACKIVHYEEYEFPSGLFLLTPFLRTYLRRAIKKELQLISLSISK